MTDRRNFLQSLSATTAVVGFGLSSPVAAISKASLAHHGDVANRFSRFLNGQFRFCGEQALHATQAELVEIVALRSDPKIEQFELVFQAPQDHELNEAIYVMTTPNGEQSAHLVQPAAGRGADRKFMVHFSLLR